MTVSAIIPAAGSGRRFGGATSKLFFKAGAKPVLFYTLKNLSEAYPFEEILVAAQRRDFGEIEKLARPLKINLLRLVEGGATRAESVRNALEAASPRSEWVLVHDAARPLVTRNIVLNTLRAAQKTGAAIAAVPATSTVKRVDARGLIERTENREALFLAQTPQVVKKELLKRRYGQLGRRALALTDEASFFDGTSTRVSVARGSATNLKITTPEDIELFCFYLKRL